MKYTAWERQQVRKFLCRNPHPHCRLCLHECWPVPDSDERGKWLESGCCGREMVTVEEAERLKEELCAVKNVGETPT